MSTGVGVGLAILGALLIVCGIYFIRVPGLCAPGESHIICLRSWVAALGPLVAGVALLVAIAQFGLAKESSQRQLRAYIGVVPVLEFPNPTTINLIVDNQGQTPAYDVKTIANWWQQPFGTRLPANFDFKDNSTPDQLISSAVLQSKKDATFSISIDSTALKRAQDKQISLFYYGWVTYIDVFGERHRTTFCFQYFPHLKDEQIVGHQLVMQPMFNTAD